MKMRLPGWDVAAAVTLFLLGFAIFVFSLFSGSSNELLWLGLLIMLYAPVNYWKEKAEKKRRPKP